VLTFAILRMGSRINVVEETAMYLFFIFLFLLMKFFEATNPVKGTHPVKRAHLVHDIQ